MNTEGNHEKMRSERERERETEKITSETRKKGLDQKKM